MAKKDVYKLTYNTFDTLFELRDTLASSLVPLKQTHNLLGFSGGVDSTALFFLLLECEISFDIAIVHYHTRPQADDEVAYAKELAATYNKLCFVAHAPHFDTNFEHNARSFRFDFFRSLITKHCYTHLLLAHQLNDRLEWLLMQLTKGAGLGNLLGFSDERYNDDESFTHYTIVRPLESMPKNALYRFCKERGIKYFEDSSNQDKTFRRNYFRYEFCDKLVNEFSTGIARTLSYLQRDKQSLENMLYANTLELESLQEQIQKQIYNVNVPLHTHHIRCIIFSIHKVRAQNDDNLLLLFCDKVAKRCGYVLSAAQREEISKSNFNCKIAHLIITSNAHRIYIAQDFINMYKIVTQGPMSKKFKICCASHCVPPKLRLLLWAEFCAWEMLHKTTHRDSYYLVNEQTSQHTFSHFMTKIDHFFTF
ncbi:tRNA lysidine(34) synthetase TilS [Helicobacter sp. MIT 21-1697]|uniref:tRNA lysidine(34) synthetase TilS n=1 Tax=Helicobacter sp. MIT 21-1697 TaxID=2993733 RepID=UPI00224AEE5F|nr:tRNA lysidine(34) synthetase TilS [Helicobacter sp. MIT 21-1697]MCX2717153.1 tRNA lysidine(34) synthetase TilS [Helicobacter sp. MIT 21-1697]